MSYTHQEVVCTFILRNKGKWSQSPYEEFGEMHITYLAVVKQDNKNSKNK